MAGLFKIPLRNLVFFGGLILGLVVLYITIVQVPVSARTKIENILKSSGFDNVAIGAYQSSIGGFSAQDIKLDEFGFDRIKSIHIRINWLSFFLTGDMGDIKIDGLHITKTSEDLNFLVSSLSQKILNLPKRRVELSNNIIDIATNFGDIRVTGDITAMPSGDGDHDIKAKILSNQFQMGFEINWQGTLTADGKFDLFGDIIDGRLNTKPLTISRLSGWSSLSNKNDNGITAQISMLAGRANFKDIPLQSFSLQGQKNVNSSDLIVRAGISGMPDVLFSADISNSTHTQNSSIVFKGKNLSKLLMTLEQKQARKKNIPDSLANVSDFSLMAELQPELRFSGGPLPYAININLNNTKSMSGNMLIYTDTWEARGALEINDGYIADIKKYFDVPEENINNNYIRLDGNLKPFTDDAKKQ